MRPTERDTPLFAACQTHEASSSRDEQQRGKKNKVGFDLNSIKVTTKIDCQRFLPTELLYSKRGGGDDEGEVGGGDVDRTNVELFRFLFLVFIGEFHSRHFHLVRCGLLVTV